MHPGITRRLITSGSVDGRDTAFKLFTGYMFDRHFGVESAYVDLGEVSYNGAFSGDLVTGGKDDGTDISFGLGVGYNFTRNLGVRAEWERFKLDDADADLLCTGIIWRF